MRLYFVLIFLLVVAASVHAEEVEVVKVAEELSLGDLRYTITKYRIEGNQLCIYAQKFAYAHTLLKEGGARFELKITYPTGPTGYLKVTEVLSSVEQVYPGMRSVVRCTIQKSYSGDRIGTTAPYKKIIYGYYSGEERVCVYLAEGDYYIDARAVGKTPF